ncbi:DUF1963 domain-containing protein [Novipirellula caenicola]|uniref:DUF2262 domain-containing protein n=1 Tax=Novipirellula caenicola TaxID=1536901 RepID=A0ABP9W3M8_9BACT
MNASENQLRSHTVAAYALGKPHTQTETGMPLDTFGFRLSVVLRGSYDDFLVDITRGRSRRLVARFGVPKADQARWVASDPAISESEYVPRRGLAFIDVELNGETNDLCRTLIDQCYDRMMSQLSDHQRLVLELTQSQLSEDEILDRLIESYGLSDLSTSILAGVVPATLLVPLPSSSQLPPLGASFVGGVPDLDPADDWPVTSEGRPLGFLGQFNLEDFGDSLPDSFPRKGVLSIFSVWAHHDPKDEEEEWNEPFYGRSNAPTKIQVTPLEQLSRRSAPQDVRPYPCVEVRAVRVPDLGAVERSQPFDNLDWDDPQVSALQSLQDDFDAIVMHRYYGDFNSMHGHHRLGGAGRYQQEFPEELRETDLKVIATFGTDNLTQMQWGDGGDLTLLADMDEIRSGGTTDVWTENQGG